MRALTDRIAAKEDGMGEKHRAGTLDQRASAEEALELYLTTIGGNISAISQQVAALRSLILELQHDLNVVERSPLADPAGASRAAPSTPRSECSSSETVAPIAALSTCERSDKCRARPSR